MLIKLLLVFVVVWFLCLRWVRRRKIQCFKQFRNDIPSVPLIGHAYMMVGDGQVKMRAVEALGREAFKQGGVTKMESWILDKFYAIVADAEIAEFVLRNCLEKDDSMKLFKSVFGNGLLISPVPEWRPRRRVLNPAFTMKNLNQFVEIFGRNSAILAKKLRKVSENGPFSIYNYISAYSSDSVFESIYGLELHAQQNPQHPMMKALRICCQLVANRLCLPWLHNQTVYEMTSQCAELKKNGDLLNNFIDENIVKKCKEYENETFDSDAVNDSQSGPKKPKTILQLMLEFSKKNNESLSEVYLREDTFVVTFAGIDTTSVGMSFITLMLSRHPEVQEKVHKEISEIFGDSPHPIEAEDLSKLKYTEAVIKEVLRLYPPVPLMLRKVEKDIVLPSGKYLVAGTGILINVWAVNRNPKYWGDNADLFLPERFLVPSPYPAAFLSFSYGVRNCIGYQFALMSMKTSLTTLLQQYRILPATDVNDSKPKKMDHNDHISSHKPLRLQIDVMLRDADNFTVQFVSRT